MSDLNVSDARLGIIGLGYVGLPLAVEFGKQRVTVGFDINNKRIEELRAGRDATQEVDADELKSAHHLTFSSDLDDLAACTTYIVTEQPDLTGPV